MQIQRTLPKEYEPYVDKYFLRSKEILEKEGINPVASMKVFTRGEGRVAGLEDAVETILNFSDIEKTGEIWITKKDSYETKDPLMVVKAPILSYIDLETLYLGILSDAITQEAGLSRPSSREIKEKFERLKSIYQDIPITYFGARHYHWSLDKEIARAALEGGAVQTSTDIGSSNVGKEGVGTTPHVLTLLLSSRYGREQATLMTAKIFDKYMPENIPRVTLVDTFNRELTDSLTVAEYFGDRKNIIRLDTCGENLGEGGSYYLGKKQRDPSYQTGTGVTIELATNVRESLLRNGYGDTTEVFLTSGFGDEEKAKAFVRVHQEFKAKTGYNLFAGVGVGEVSGARFCTADIFEVEGKPLYKTGRETTVDYSQLKRIV